MKTDPESTEERIELPTDFAEQVAAVSGVEDPPKTLAEFWMCLSKELAASNQTIGAEDMYKDAQTRHEVHLDDRIQYALCAIDALAAAAMEEQDPVTVHSTDPVTENTVTFVVSDDAVEVTPADAVISFGMAPANVPDEAADGSFVASISQEPPSVREVAFCHYINAFETVDAYEQWAAETDGLTIPIPATKLGSLVRQMVQRQDYQDD